MQQIFLRAYMQTWVGEIFRFTSFTFSKNVFRKFLLPLLQIASKPCVPTILAVARSVAGLLQPATFVAKSLQIPRVPLYDLIVFHSLPSFISAVTDKYIGSPLGIITLNCFAKSLASNGPENVSETFCKVIFFVGACAALGVFVTP